MFLSCTKTHQVDALILGSGAAGLTLALSLPDHLKITILCKGEKNEQAATYWAQGGIAGVIDPHDSFIDHTQDTLTAGAGLCNEQSVSFTVEQSPSAIQWLVEQGVPFSLNDDLGTKAKDETLKSNTIQRKSIKDASQNPTCRFHLTQEGGHSHRRILHAADATGKAIHSTLIENARKKSNVTLVTHAIAVDLVLRHKLGKEGLSSPGCQGIYAYNQTSQKVETWLAQATVLATGGASKAYLYTSNPDGATGDGIAMAWRAGCRVMNMEFNQFHPTCLYHPHAKSFLLTEAIRGEGGRLLLPNGESFMSRFDPRKELAPRDIVARAIDHEMKRLGADCLFLDISHKPAPFIEHHFPTIDQKLKSFGIDMKKEPIPIVPAAHYTCGGIHINSAGQTDIPYLYAIGETSYSGLHGANRMASNSLLECIVYGQSAAKHIQAQIHSYPAPLPTQAWDESLVTDSDEDVIIAHNWDELRRFMWDYVGIVRTNKRLERAKHRVDLLKREVQDYYSNYKITSDLLELRNLIVVADLMITSALRRQESRGLHYTMDYPYTSPTAMDTMLYPRFFNPSISPIA